MRQPAGSVHGFEGNNGRRGAIGGPLYPCNYHLAGLLAAEAVLALPPGVGTEPTDPPL